MVAGSKRDGESSGDDRLTVMGGICGAGVLR